MSYSHTTDSLLLKQASDRARDKKTQKTKDERLVDKIDILDEKISDLRDKLDAELDQNAKSREFLQDQLKKNFDKDKTIKKKWQKKINAKLAKQKKYAEKIQDPKLKPKIRSDNVSDSDSSSVSSDSSDTESTVENTVVMPEDSAFKERLTEASRLYTELMMKGVPHIGAIVAQKYPDVDKYWKEQEKKDWEEHTKSAEYQHRKNEAKAEKELAMAITAQNKQILAEADKKVRDLKTQIQTLRAQGKPYEEIQPIKEKLYVAENEFHTKKILHPV